MKTQPSTGSEGWILDEDRALRDLLDGIYVSDDKAPQRRVGVWFGHPDQELRAQSYPYTTIDLIDISEEMDRAQRGMYTLSRNHGFLGWEDDPMVLASGLTFGDKEAVENYSAVWMDYPIPIRLTYQITTWARNPRHDRQILQHLLQRGLTPFQRGSLDVSDGTLRRLDVMDVVKRDSVEDSKRLLSNAIIVGVSSEVPWSKLLFAADVRNVTLHFHLHRDGSTVEEELT